MIQQTKWSPASWREKVAKHIPSDYPDLEALGAVEQRLYKRPPLVVASEIENLKAELAKVSLGDGFLLQGGDCAESFHEFEADRIIRYFRLFLQMAVVFTFAGGKHVVKLGRVAGQFAKPRSAPLETIDGVTLPSYRGDNINGMEFTALARLPDPNRLLQAYDQSASTMNLLRALATGGYADLAYINDWNLDFVKKQGGASKEYLKLCHHIEESLEFIQSLSNGAGTIDTKTVSFFTSHEALLLGYEQALTRKDSLFGSGGFYSTSAHMLWIGDRTRGLDDAHIEYCRGIANPIGLKCGPTLGADELLALIDKLNPSNEAGKLVLIARFGSDKIAAHLPAMVRKVTQAGRNVVWSSDPMHGNTVLSSSGYKTRPFSRVLSEVTDFMDIVRAEGAYPGGIHLEMTGDNVTECTGGAIDVTDEGLGANYATHCDPRLNGSQSLELAFKIAKKMKAGRDEIRMAAAGL
ncbi:MAG: 3-deoxy-7-phosphoheptulonate synthase [Hyphomonadaceae bacterium]|nr:MAG: 3-deoxy-7-phosphoheptulonate synthase [Hyphomonadaceae bacterium]